MNRKDTVLIVDDESINRRILKKILSSDYDVLEAADGSTALRILKGCGDEISAVVLDLFMPGMDGYEVLRHISSEHSNLPLLVATGSQDQETEEKCLELGAWDFVGKPYKPAILTLRLHNILARSQADMAQQIQRLAERDDLTGLYNRRFFMLQTNGMLERNPSQNFALIRLDIDRFHLFNDAYGSKEGDRILQLIAGLLSQVEKEYFPCTYGRIESDVFCFCEPYLCDTLPSQLESLNRQIEALRDDYRLKASFGVYPITSRPVEMEKLYSYATEAARKCKNNYNQTFAIYDDSMGRSAAAAQEIANEMEAALRDKQFVVYLQPKYTLEDTRLCGAEALVRWKHPQKGMISPGSFIPVFEQNGFITRLDDYMWEQACILLARWIGQGRTPLPVSVNISRVSLYNPRIVDRLEELVHAYHIPHALLRLEITESAYMSNPDLMRSIIRQLHKSGFMILMDDFGSGYSSLNTLKDIDVDVLKVDMKFLPSGAGNIRSEKILASVLRMADWIGMQTIVEGVETREQVDFLRSIGCRYAQGFYFGRPMPVSDYEALEQQADVFPAPSHTEGTGTKSIDVLWSSNSEVNTLLKGISVPFAIFTFSNGKLDLLRMNDAFLRAFDGFDPQKYLDHVEFNKLKASVACAVDTKSESECECLYLLKTGESHWYHIKFQYINRVASSCVLSATFSDITTQRRMGAELSRVFHAMRTDDQRKNAMLVVDGSEVSRETLRSLFEDEYEIIPANSGAEGLQLLSQRAESIVVILLDILMPEMNGQEFLRRKNEMSVASNIPVIVISSEVSHTSQINMLKNGVNDYITKPFVPEAVVRCVKNVIEYNSRFRAMMQEYNATGLPNAAGQGPGGEVFSWQSIRYLIGFMMHIFDVVRLVDPAITAVLNFNRDGLLIPEPYTCFQVWKKGIRCENCISQCARDESCIKNKYEFIQNDIFYVTSRPLTIQQGNGIAYKCVLEVVSRVEDHLLMSRVGKHSIREMLEDTQRKIYQDPLTGAFNRRYFDEMLFLHHGQNGVATRVGLILMDMHHFKSINDRYGHTIGDRVLRDVAHTLRTQVRAEDSVIRYGGDEFLILLTNCTEAQVAGALPHLQAAVATVTYGADGSLHADAEFGYAYTGQFVRSKAFLRDMLAHADAAMYLTKRSRLAGESPAEPAHR
jgi:diguanylate cyclase (GGDEF)-like protein